MPSLLKIFVAPFFLICAFVLGAPTDNMFTGVDYLKSRTAEKDQDSYGKSNSQFGVAVERGDSASKDLLVFVHGWPDNSHVWDAQLEYFCGGAPDVNKTRNTKPTKAKTNKQYRCVALDLPGFEPGAQATPAYDFGALARSLITSTINAQGVSGMCSRSCHSY
jgi:pimeloyl-ACP methyl ester carboxylesterase